MCSAATFNITQWCQREFVLIEMKLEENWMYIWPSDVYSQSCIVSSCDIVAAMYFCKFSN